MTTIWAWRKLKELNDLTGFVAVDDAKAAKLIEEGKVQDPKIGGKFLKHIDDTPRQTRKAPAVKRTPKAPPVKRTPVKAIDEHVKQD